jgi:hypothetical protein
LDILHDEYLADRKGWSKARRASWLSQWSKSSSPKAR